jgi:hypothetical protein
MKNQSEQDVKSKRIKLSHFQRVNYYFGKMMTVRDFQDQQKYYNEKRWMLNRLGLGWGVLCGLKVEPCANGEDPVVIVHPGFALDRNGNEIWVAEPSTLNLKEYLGDSLPEEEPTEYYITIKYKECPIEPRPIPVEDCGTFDADCVYDRTGEGYQFYVHLEALPMEPPAEIKDLFNCNADCSRVLADPALMINAGCSERKACMEIPLARVYFDKDNNLLVDNSSNRQLAYSNEKLYKLIDCLKKQLWKAHSAAYDRKRFVPLLAQTIKGINHQDGVKYALNDMGVLLTRITSDGDYIWITDRGSKEFLRYHHAADLSRPTEEIIEKHTLKEWANNSWGIAFDGHYIWLTHPETTGPGKLTRINICDPHDQVAVDVPDNPQEIVFDGRYLWVSRRWSEENGNGPGGENGKNGENGNDPNTLYVSKIDPLTCEVVEAEIPLEPVDSLTPVSPIKGMAFDGFNVWVTYTATNGRRYHAVARKIVEDPSAEEPLIAELKGHETEDITFDGTHIWVSHDQGISKVDIRAVEEVKSTVSTTHQTALAFDGGVLWTAELGESETKLNRTNIFSCALEGSEEILSSIDKSAEFSVSKICYDGVHIWVIAVMETASNEKVVNNGIIYRLLP